jgi:hypothetical protein
MIAGIEVRPMLPLIACSPVPPPEPPQALTRAQFAGALALHGFAATVGPFDLAFIDRRTGKVFPGVAVRANTPDGGGYIDRLATLKSLLAWRREILARRRWRRTWLRRLITLRRRAPRPRMAAEAQPS